MRSMTYRRLDGTQLFVAVTSALGATALMLEMERELAVTPQAIAVAVYQQVFARAERTGSLPGPLSDGEWLLLEACEAHGAEIDAAFGEASAAYYARHSRPASYVA